MKKNISTLTKHNLLIRFIKSLIKLFKRHPKITSSIELPKEAIYIANHSGASGPLTFSIYFPKLLVPWGAYPMMGNYLSRWRYLYHVFYRKKLSYGPIRSFILSTLFGLLSKILYVGVHLIPTYPDLRFKTTIELSILHLEQHNSILIFPEDSTNGYQDEIKSFHDGFIYLAKKYFDFKNEHIPIVPVYYHQLKNQIIIGQSYTINQFDASSNQELSEEFRSLLNQLGQSIE